MHNGQKLFSSSKSYAVFLCLTCSTLSAAASCILQAVAKGQTVTYDKDGFPDLSCLDLENNQEALRYEGIVAAANERRQNQRESRQQPASSSAARTPFASGRPQHDDRSFPKLKPFCCRCFLFIPLGEHCSISRACLPQVTAQISTVLQIYILYPKFETWVRQQGPQGCSQLIALHGQDLPCMCLPQYELERVLIVIKLQPIWLKSCHTHK